MLKPECALGHIPAVDMSPIYDTPSIECPNLLQALVDSLSRHRAVRLTGHGIPSCRVRKVFELSQTFFELPKQIKASAAMAPCPGGGLSRGYRARHDGTGAEFFAASPPYETHRPTRWPIGVRGEVFKMTIQAFLRSCLRLHDDLLGVLEVALDLPDDELTACWARQNGEVRLGYYPPRAGKPLSKKEVGEPDEDEEGHSKDLLTLVFQENAHDEVVLFCGPALNKWLGGRSRRDPRYSYAAKDDQNSEPKRYTNGFPSSSQYSISFTGCEDMTIAC